MAEQRSNMKTTKYKCAIFDLDGTLLYTLESINNALNETMRLVGYPEHTLNDTLGFVNFGSVELIRRALPENKRAPEEVMRVHEIYAPILQRHSSVGTKPYDGIIEVCKELRGAGVTLCVMSNKPDASAKKCIDTYFDSGLFKIVRGSVPGKFIKPDAEFTLDVIKEAGFSKEDCIIIGDSIVDLQTAKNAGCPCLWVKWGYGTEENIGGVSEFIAEKTEDLLSIIL